MAEFVTITLDGAQLRTPANASVLDTANEYGVCIPHLCHHPGLRDVGACRLCLVEVVTNGRGKVTASCTLQAQEGMVVRTSTDKLRRLRMNIAELLVAEAPNSRAIQDVAARCGVKSVRYKFHNANCVQCGRCVRVCDEMWQARALGFAGRGQGRKVSFPFGQKPKTCKGCNTCIELCPMTIAPCPGAMKTGEEYLCRLCESQVSMNASTPDTCSWCKLGEGFGCARQTARSRRVAVSG